MTQQTHKPSPGLPRPTLSWLISWPTSPENSSAWTDPKPLTIGSGLLAQLGGQIEGAQKHKHQHSNSSSSVAAASRLILNRLERSLQHSRIGCLARQSRARFGAGSTSSDAGQQEADTPEERHRSNVQTAAANEPTANYGRASQEANWPARRPMLAESSKWLELELNRKCATRPLSPPLELGRLLLAQMAAAVGGCGQASESKAAPS